MTGSMVPYGQVAAQEVAESYILVHKWREVEGRREKEVKGEGEPRPGMNFQNHKAHAR